MIAKFFDRRKGDLSHYYTNLYHIIKFIDNSEIENKYQYTSFIRAQLSAQETYFLFYNCLSPMGKNKFKPLVEKYALLKNLDFALITNKEHVKAYQPSAFQSNT